MGIYDRDYYRPTQSAPGYSSFKPRSVVIALIVVNVAVWLIDGLFMDGILRSYMKDFVAPSDSPVASKDTLTHPWLWWQFLTSGFVHAPGFEHIFFNMLALYIFGRDVEDRYGSKEFLRLYLVMLVFSSLVWDVVNKLSSAGPVGSYGASGAISGVVILYALNFPHRTLLLFFVIPMPAWMVGILFVLLDMFGVFGVAVDTNIAFSAHLAGAAFAFIYFQQRWNLTSLTEGRFGRLRSLFRRKPRLKVHKPENDAESDMAEELDRVLAKLHREGEGSLTRKERRKLEDASRTYQNRRRG